MESEIKKMDKMRRNILKGLLIGCGIWLGLVVFSYFFLLSSLYPSIKPFLQEIKYYYLGAGIFGFLVFLVFLIKFLVYKKNLKKDSVLRLAVNDERIKENWFRAYRFSFYTIFIVQVIWIVIEAFPVYKYFPDGTIITIYVAVMSLIGSFLLYNREVQDG